jgi:O-antigen/teichoic acid export membrane protein
MRGQVSLTNPSSAEARTIIRGLQWTYVSVALQGILKLAALMILARLLTPRDFGLLGFALLCTNFIERIAQGGIAPAVVQLESAPSAIISTAWWMSLVLGVISTVVIFVSAGQMAMFFGEHQLEPIIKALSIGCLLEALIAVPEALLQRELKCREIMFSENLGYLVSMVGICTVLAFIGYGVWSLVVAQLALKVVRLIVITALAPKYVITAGSLDQVRHLARMSFGFSLGRLLNFFSLQGDNFVVGRMLGTEALGMYNRAYQLMTLPAMYVGQVFERVMFPAMARKQSAKEELGKEFLIALEVLTLIALPVGVAMFVLAREIVLVGFGERWRSVIPVVSVLSFGVFFRTAYKCSDTVVRSVGAVYHYAARQALYAGLVIGGAILGSLIDGVAGVACGVVVAVAINYVSMTRLSIRLVEISIRQLLRAHLVGIWGSFWVGVALLGTIETLRATSTSSFVVLFFGGVIATLTWGSSLLVIARFVPYGVMKVVCGYVRSKVR